MSDFISIERKADLSPRQCDYYSHIHDYYEILYFICGDCRFSIEGSIYQLNPGDIIIICDLEHHHLILDSDSRYERMVIHFKEDFFNSFDSSAFLLRPFNSRSLGQCNLYSAKSCDTSKLRFYLDRIMIQQQKQASPSLLYPYLFTFLIELNDLFDQKLQEKTIPSDSLAHQITAFINQHLCEDISLHDIADHFFISKPHLNRIFQTATGMTVWNYVISKRLLLARSRIQNGQLISYVCQDCGFHDYSSFFKLYKKKFGISPKEDKRV